MIKEFKKLTDTEADLLYKAPVFVSVLASSSYNKINEAQKADAIKLAHLKTYTANPALLSYYLEVEKEFKEEFETTVKAYYPFDDIKRNALKREMKRIGLIILKLDKGYADLLRKSLEGYARHVKRAAHSIFQDFIFPVHIDGLTD
ncbi:MAG: hypothetical protein ABI402_14425 [Ferruginibacter sp.]